MTRRRYSERETALVSDAVFMALDATKAMTSAEIAEKAGTTVLRAAAVLNGLVKNELATSERLNTKAVAWKAKTPGQRGKKKPKETKVLNIEEWYAAQWHAERNWRRGDKPRLPKSEMHKDEADYIAARRRKMLRAIEEKPGIQRKDICALFPEVSSTSTIQRDLDQLRKAGRAHQKVKAGGYYFGPKFVKLAAE